MVLSTVDFLIVSTKNDFKSYFKIFFLELNVFYCFALLTITVKHVFNFLILFKFNDLFINDIRKIIAHFQGGF